MINLETHRHYWEILPDIRHMWDAHYDESARNKEVFKLAPALETYCKVSDEGNFLSVVAYDDGVAIGYSVCFLAPHPHYAGALIAWNDLLYVQQAYREGLAGGRLMVQTRREAKALGCLAVSWHAKPRTELDALLSKRMRINEHIYIDKL